jgi:hypothetical protein
VLNRPLQSVCPGFEDTQRHLLVNSRENFSNRVREILPALTILVRWFSFDISKKEELTRFSAVADRRQPFSYRQLVNSVFFVNIFGI